MTTTQKTAPSNTVSNGTTSALNFLLRRIRRNPEFPGISEHISEISQKLSGDEKVDAQDISNTILKDYALTHKILRLVNSASYGNYGGEISTISRAVVILGYEKIRAIALSIILFDNLGKNTQIHALKDTICCSFLSAVVAKKLSGYIPDIDTENAFISAMFNNLGEFLTIHYFPEEYSEITKQRHKDNSNHNQTIRNILGASYAELGTGIATEWQLPSSLIDAMQEQPEGSILKPDSPNKAISHLSSFSNELSNIAGSDRIQINKTHAIETLSSRYKKSINVSPEFLQKTLDESLEELTQFANAIGVNVTDSTFYHQLTTKIEHPPEQDNDIEIDIIPTETESVISQQLTMINGISDITQSMLGDFELNQVINMVIETIYRGMGFNRVVFCLRNAPKKTMQARFGLGDDIREIIPKFKFKLMNSDDVFNAAINRKKEFIILDTKNSEYKQRIPSWCNELTAPASIVLFPIIINNMCIGLLYADNIKKTHVTSEQIQFFNALRNQAALAIQQKKGRK